MRISFLQRLCSSICGSRSFRQAGIVWSQICCVGLLLSCMSELMSFKCDVYLRGKSASSNFNAFAFRVSSSGADPGSLIAQYKSKAHFFASFVIPLASRKLRSAVVCLPTIERVHVSSSVFTLSFLRIFPRFLVYCRV